MTKTQSRLTRAAAAFAVMFALAPGAVASRPVHYTLESRADIEKGSADGVSIAEDGTISLAPASDVVFDTGQTYVWSSAADARGNVYLGTGPEGKLFVVDAAGKGRQLFDAEELNVTAVAVDPSGGLFVATSPDGKVYRIGADGAATVHFDPEDKYIWSLAMRGGALYAGTGERGIIYRIAGAGRGEPFVDTDELHIMTLAFAENGDLYAGTDPGALLLRVTPDGRAFTLFDSPLQEMHSVRVGPDGDLYALAIAGSAATTASEQTSASIVESTTTTATGTDLASLGTVDVKSRRDTSDAKSAVHRIAPDGTSDVVWSSRTVVAYAVEPERERVLVGTGDRGRVYAVDRAHRTTLLLQTYEDQTSTFVRAGLGLLATSNTMGRLFRVGPNAVAKGTYESPVHDAKALAAWGRLTLRGATGVTAETRSGNTDTPDSTWSAWTQVALQAGSGPIPSPPARYMQWRLTLAGPGARVESSSVGYLPRNVAPEVTTIAVFPSGIGLQETPTQPVDPGILVSGYDPQVFGLSTNLAPRKIYQKGARSFTWQGKDPDDERLAYTVSFRALNESAWHVLATGLDRTWFTVDSDALPDGIYVFRITADDSPSNPIQFALSGSRDTEPVEIDNTGPSVTPGAAAVTAGGVEVSIRAQDTTSRLTKAEYSVDGGPWVPVYSDDGILDGPQESFRLRIPKLPPGEHSIAFRATDASLNVGSGKVTVTIR